MKNNYSIQNINSKSEWNELFEKANFKHMTQTWAFGEAKRATNWRPRRLAINSNGEKVAICQVLYRTVLGIPVAARINLGPMTLKGHADKDIDVLIAIRRHWRLLRHGILLIHPSATYSEESAQSIQGMGFRLRNGFKWSSSRIDLTKSEDELRKSLTSQWRKNLKSSGKHGLQFVSGNSTEDAEWIIQRHIENAAEKNFVGPEPDLIRALYQASPEDFNVFRVVHEHKSIAGMVVFRFDEVAYAYISWNSSEGRKVNAGNFIFWNAALELKRIGCSQFDLGGHGLQGSSGFGHFKLGLNGIGYQLVGEFVSI